MTLAEKANIPNPGMPIAGEASEEAEEALLEVAVAPEPVREPEPVAVAEVVAVCQLYYQLASVSYKDDHIHWDTSRYCCMSCKSSWQGSQRYHQARPGCLPSKQRIHEACRKRAY
jgi:hypothetical protein